MSEKIDDNEIMAIINSVYSCYQSKSSVAAIACGTVLNCSNSSYRKTAPNEWVVLSDSARKKSIRKQRLDEAKLTERTVVGHPDDFDRIRAYARGLYVNRGIEF